MAVTKTARTLQAPATNAAGASTTGSAIDLTTALGLSGTLQITNGSTAPTVACTAYIDVSNDAGTTWRQWLAITAGLTASTAYTYPFSLPAEILYARARFGGNTGQGVTVECLGHELTSV
ncbi:hypothetical protein DesfrDRAFT_0163 [Solidesulfovibrio fructosivorans JJ]]|uniref:Uncharacterized protein n=1 Tax=Solidesulfovibrio fructosivorans JJ] TaxID=596151 RepID=E1JRB4_SOLFR|nr:hypothetical protein [Solidesulfovibrio fructosivorans]EFL53115.1 hypothetical protein DesfrDRAFT_0163 [Solidesulfovibrio fructosivorans JJ]]